MFRLCSLLAASLALALALVSGAAPAALAAVASPADSCTDCIAVPDPCCSALPNFQFPGAPTLSPNILVATRQAVAQPWVLTIYDMASPLPPGPENANWQAITRYNGPGPGWTADSLGTVFGLTLDEYGNIFVAHSSAYGGDALGQVFGGGAGAVYRIDGVTGKITTFVKLPNFQDTAEPTGEDMPGLGNITYDCAHKQFFVTNMEDGKIYRVKPVGVNGATGTVVQTFDPLGADNGAPGWAPPGERLWAVQIHGNRVFYSVWVEDMTVFSPQSNAIRSVQLDPSGAFMPGTDKLELNLPDAPWTSSFPFPGSSPVSDISFDATGKMLLAERVMSGATFSGAHAARLLEYECVNWCWQRTNAFNVGDCCGQVNSAGGCDYDRMPYGGPSQALGRTWVSADAMHLGSPYTDVIYGLQGFRPTGGSVLNSILVDADGDTLATDKVYQGDVEKPGCPPATVGKLCGVKFSDLDHDGVLDAGEPGVSGWTITLSGPGGPYTASTDGDGAYCFDNLPPGTYTVGEVMQPGWVPTTPAGATHAVTVAAGQTIGGLDFGNYYCGSGNCAQAPLGMAAWWAFDEPVGSPTASDLVHLSPARNVMQLTGAAITPGGVTGRALCFANENDYARIPNANSVNLNVAGQSFAMDAWLRAPASAGTQRVIAEKRTLLSSSPLHTSGWALYLDGLQLKLEIGQGGAPMVFAGPTLVANTWTHFAVSVDRVTGQGTWYENGTANSAFAFTVPAGFAYSAADAWFGHASPAFAGEPFLGCLDEFEFFYNKTLRAADVQAIWAAAAAGKCRDVLRVPAVTSICKDDSTVTVCFNVCNTAATAQSYHWAIAPLPAGPGCTVGGPTVVTPASGTVTVGASGCSTPICVVMKRPAGLTAQNATACFAVTIVNDSTGRCQTKQGAIRADNTCFCVKANSSAVVNVAARVIPSGVIGVPIGVGVGFPCDPMGRVLQLRATARFSDATQDDGVARISLNGLPPGEPAIVDVAPSGLPEETATFFAEWIGEHDPAAALDLVIEADTDGDGLFEEMCSVPLASSFDSASVASAPPGAGVKLVAALRASPNPSFGAAQVAFTLPVAGRVELGVYDVNGRVVRTLHRGAIASGTHTLDWDGRDAAGRHAPAGVYFVRLELPGRTLNAKLVKLR